MGYASPSPHQPGRPWAPCSSLASPEGAWELLGQTLRDQQDPEKRTEGKAQASRPGEQRCLQGGEFWGEAGVGGVNAPPPRTGSPVCGPRLRGRALSGALTH